MTLPDVFQPHVGVILQGYCEQSRKDMRSIPLFMVSLIFHSLITIGLMIFEYELIYKVFEYLSGEDSEYYSPRIMGFSSFILVIAIHFFAERSKQHPVLRLINKVAGMSMLIYALGIASMLSLLVFADSGDLFSADTLGLIVEPVDSDESMNWSATFMAYVTSPLGKILFSVGIGVLVIINLFASHHAIDKAKQAGSEIVRRRAAFSIDQQDLSLYQQSFHHYCDLEARKESFTPKNDTALKDEVAQEVLLTIQEALSPTLIAVRNAQVLEEISSILPHSQLNIEQVKAAIAPIEAITHDNIVKAMK